jgi:siderophore synthetase component
LSEQESKVVGELASRRPDLVEPFRAALEKGRRGILLRLLQAAVRENIAGLGERISWLNGGHSFEIGLSGDRRLRAFRVRRLSLGRFDVHGKVTLLDSDASVDLEHPLEFLELLRDEGLVDGSDPDALGRFERFSREIDNSSANLALSFAGAKLRRRSLLAGDVAQCCGTSVKFAELMMELDPLFSPLAFFEQWVIEGHPLHPCTRMKIGMDFTDVIQNAPEWGGSPSVALVAVDRTLCRVYSRWSEGAGEVLFREYPEVGPTVAETLVQAGKCCDDYELIPVHPWQIRHTIPFLHADAIRRREIVPIPGVEIASKALMSVRSLAPVQRRGEGKHHFKTAINVHMTSAVRTVSPNAAENGPLLSGVLARISEREHGFSGRLVVLSEDVGVHYQPDDPSLDPLDAATQIKHLAAIMRENPENYAGESEFCLPAAALTARSPFGRRPIVVELIEDFARHVGISDDRAAAVEFVRRYAEVSVPAFLTLMTRYGIGLEGHMQNCVCVFKRGELVRMLVRNLGAVRIMPERMVRQAISLEIVPGSAILAHDLEDLQNKVYYSFFQNHLAELFAAVVRHFEIDEQAFWDEVAQVARRTCDELKSHPETHQQAFADEQALFRPTLSLKALATMRLKGDVTDYTYRSVPNPLYLSQEFAEGKTAR